MKNEEIVVRPSRPEEADAAMAIGARLPKWFTARGLDLMRCDLPFQHLLVASAADRIVGFVSCTVHEGHGRIGWMGVEPERRRRGVGRALIARLSEDLRVAGVADVLVATLGDSVEYPPYAETRAFYRAVGFVDHDRVMQDDPECPEQLTLRLELA